MFVNISIFKIFPESKQTFAKIDQSKILSACAGKTEIFFLLSFPGKTRNFGFKER